MPYQSELSEVEVRRERFHKGKGKSECKISKTIKRSKTPIHNVLSKK